MHRMSFAIIFLFSLCAQPRALAGEKLINKPNKYKADIYSLEGDKKQVYNQTSVSEIQDGELYTYNAYYYGREQKKKAVEEKVFYRDGQLEKYIIIHHQLQETWETSISYKEKRVFFRKRKWEDKTWEEDDEKLVDHFVLAPMVVPYLQKHWKKVLAGETLYVRFGVPARQDTVGFNLSKIGEETIDGQMAVKLKMEPSSFFIALFVDPMFMYMTRDSEDMLKLEGLTLPRKKIGGKWKDSEVLTIFHNPKD